ncbi:MAG TPA: type II secretion system protein [Candidatus Methylacidiphilales bacterium]|nr:type II secretion system protein [Candidatus Methylacidiphilales bacterium]
MKSSFRTQKTLSFTLVELLVVIAIISILASALLVGGSMAIKAAERAKAGAMAQQLQVAALNYYNDYNTYPMTPNTQAPYVYGTNDVENWENLSWALCGNINVASPGTPVTPTVSNTRGNQYLQLPKSYVDNNGIPLNPATSNSKTGPYFNIAFDGAYCGVISNVPIFTPGSVTTNNMQGQVYVWVDCNSGSGNDNPNFWVHAP